MKPNRVAAAVSLLAAGAPVAFGMQQRPRDPRLRQRREGRLRRQADVDGQRFHRAGQRDDKVRRGLQEELRRADAELHRQRVGRGNHRIPRRQNRFRRIGPTPLSGDQYAAAKQRCGGADAWNLPVVFGPMAITYNLTAMDTLVLDAPTLAKIFNGTITRWDDPAITALNASMPAGGDPRRSTAATPPAPPTTSRPTCRPPPAGPGKGRGQDVQRWRRHRRPGQHRHLGRREDHRGRDHLQRIVLRATAGPVRRRDQDPGQPAVVAAGAHRHRHGRQDHQGRQDHRPR